MEDAVTTTPTARARRNARVLLAPFLLGAAVLAGVGAAAPGASAVPATKPKPSPFSTLERSLTAEEHLTFKVTYVTHGAGASQTMTFEQRPPDLRFGAGSGYILDLAGKTYFCASTLGHAICVKSGTTTSPLLGLTGLFEPSSVVAALKSLQATAATTSAGVKFSTTTKSIAGQPSTCLSVTVKARTYEYCVTKAKGILAYGGTNGEYVELTSYASSAPAGDFALPASGSITTG